MGQQSTAVQYCSLCIVTETGPITKPWGTPYLTLERLIVISYCKQRPLSGMGLSLFQCCGVLKALTVKYQKEGAGRLV